MKDVFHAFLVAAVLFGSTLAFSQMPDYSPMFDSRPDAKIEALERRIEKLERELRAIRMRTPAPAAAMKPSQARASRSYP